jgi:hypothetical protein
MTWTPISLPELESLVTSDLAECSEELRALFARVRIEPTKWRQRPWGNEGGGFWAVAVHRDRVLWYNDIECGFNVSRFADWGEIPDREYWCNQDKLPWALPRLVGQVGSDFGTMAMPSP